MRLNRNMRLVVKDEDETCVQFLAGSRDDKSVTLWMWVPLYICHVPCAPLRKKSRYFKW